MPDTAEDTQAAGQPEPSSDDSAAVEQMLAEAINQVEPQQPALAAQDDAKGQEQQGQAGGKTDPWSDPEAARKEITRLRKEAADWRTKYRSAEPQLSEYQKWLDSQKTEQQKLAEAKDAAEQELAQLRVSHARLMAAATYDLDPDLIEFLGEGTEEEIAARAKLLAEKYPKAASAAPAPEAKPAPAATRPVEALTPGARPANETPADPNEAFRSFLSRRRT